MGTRGPHRPKTGKASSSSASPTWLSSTPRRSARRSGPAARLPVVSESQRRAAIGELGAVGRLTAETCGYELVSVIPCAHVPPEEAPPRTDARAGRVARGRIVPDDAFVVLWSGGFNVWSDVATLGAGAGTATRRG